MRLVGIRSRCHLSIFDLWRRTATQTGRNSQWEIHRLGNLQGLIAAIALVDSTLIGTNGCILLIFLGLLELCSGYGIRNLESDGQNGHIHPPIVQRSANLWSRRFISRDHRQMLQGSLSLLLLRIICCFYLMFIDLFMRKGTSSRLGGVTFQVLAEETRDRHMLTFQQRECDTYTLREPGTYHWRHGGEKHVNDPNSIGNLQVFSISNDDWLDFLIDYWLVE